MFVTDYLYENGVTDNVKAVGQIGELLQGIDIKQWQCCGERNLIHVGQFIENAINELYEALKDYDAECFCQEEKS